jgi:hypothetical protein
VTDYAEMWDPVGQLIIELREAPEVAAIAGANPSTTVPRVRGQEPGPGDAQGAGQYRAFVLVRTQALPRHPSVPVQRARHLVQCFGRDWIEADRLYRACSDALHHAGPRLTGASQAIYVSHDDTGGAALTDPDTGQPCYEFVVESVASTQVLA